MNEKRKRIIVHVDMDAFYSSIEQMDRAEYCNRPVVVGADPRGGRGRGVVSAASYEARKYGIHSAMPISQAYRLCPEAVYVRPRMRRYESVSKHIMRILEQFSPLVEQISIDEAFLDCTGTEALTGPENILAMSIKERIRQETTLTASVGVASNKSIAKIASELCKPDGLLVCPSGEEGKFIENLSLKCLWGAGEKTVKTLNSLGYTTIGDVAKSSRAVLEKIFGKHGLKLWRLANGIDERPVKNEGSRKSIGEEITFSRDVESDSYIEHVLFRISDRLTRKMRILGLKGRTVSIKIRLQGFETFTRGRTLDFPVNDMKTIRSMSLELFRHFDRKDKKVRLVGISVSNFGVKPAHLNEQFVLFRGDRIEDSMKKEKIAGQSGTDPDALLDKMKKLYGEKVTRAAFLPNLYEKERGCGGD